jgi:glycosyltransferase involved in cell wall biosynthesis
LKLLDNKVSVIIPTLNEESGIRNTISSIPQTSIRNLGYDLEIIVIDGNSTDCTRQIAKEMGARVILQDGKGYGSAFKTGFKAASGDLIVTLDADNTYPAEIIPECLSQMEKKDLDFISVNRFAKLDKNSMSLIRKVGNKILSVGVQLLYSFKIQDSQSGMHIMRRSFTEKITLRADGFQVSEELKIIAFKHFKSLEVDGRYYPRIGKSKLNAFNHGFSNLKYLFVFRKLQRLAVAVPLIPASVEKTIPPIAGKTIPPIAGKTIAPSVDKTLTY